MNTENSDVPTVIVGVGAGIAAYKAVIVVRSLQKHGYRVHVIPTPSSLNFVGASTWEGILGEPVYTGVFEGGGAFHVKLAREADAIVVVPATASVLSKVCTGSADDLLSLVILACTAPVIFFPAMHTAMFENAATQDNIKVLRKRGYVIFDPDTGALGSGDTGVGRLPDPDVIAKFIFALIEDTVLATHGDRHLAGVTVMVTLGGTREPIDPVRYIGNRSSGLQGKYLALAAARRGARVIAISSASEISASIVDNNIEIISVETALEMKAAVDSHLSECDALFMVAAVADFRPAKQSDMKIKKDPLTQESPVITLVRNPDILADVARSPQRPRVLVGFAAETGDEETVLNYGRIKACDKGADLLAVNAVGDGKGFGNVENNLVLFDRRGDKVAFLTGPKYELAEKLLDQINPMLGNIYE